MIWLDFTNQLFIFRCSKERLRGYLRFSNRRLRRSCDTVTTTTGTPNINRAMRCCRKDSTIEEGFSETASYLHESGSTWLAKKGKIKINTDSFSNRFWHCVSITVLTYHITEIFLSGHLWMSIVSTTFPIRQLEKTLGGIEYT